MAEQRRNKSGHQTEDKLLWMANVVNNLVFNSSRVWKSHSPDKFDFIYARILFHTGELLKRFSEDTAYDILADIEMPSTKEDVGFFRSVEYNQDSDVDQERSDKEDDRERGSCPSETYYPSLSEESRNKNKGYESDHSSSVDVDNTDLDTEEEKSLQSQEWFSHLLVQQFVNKQLEVMDMYNDDFISFDEIIGPKDNCQDLYKATLPPWKRAHTTNINQVSYSTLTTVYYNNPFDTKPLFHDLLFKKCKSDTSSTCSWSGTLAGLITPDEMKSIHGVNIPIVYEQHIYKYRRFLNTLSLEAVLKDPTTLLQPCGTPQYHKNSIHRLEVLKMDRVIPIDWHQLSVTELEYMKRITNENIRQIWKDTSSQNGGQSQPTVFRRSPGPSKKLTSKIDETIRDTITAFDTLSLDEHQCDEVFIPTFRCMKPTNYLGIAKTTKCERTQSPPSTEQKVAVPLTSQRLAYVRSIV